MSATPVTSSSRGIQKTYVRGESEALGDKIVEHRGEVLGAAALLVEDSNHGNELGREAESQPLEVAKEREVAGDGGAPKTNLLLGLAPAREGGVRSQEAYGREDIARGTTVNQEALVEVDDDLGVGGRLKSEARGKKVAAAAEEELPSEPVVELDLDFGVKVLQ